MMTTLREVPWPWKLCDGLKENFLCRTFAVHCAYRAWRHADSNGSALVIAAVEGYLRGEVSWEAVREIRQKSAGGAAGAGTIGMRKRAPSAAAQIAAWQVALDQPQEAVDRVMASTVLAAGFAALWYRAEREDARRVAVEEDFGLRMERTHQQNPKLLEEAKKKELAFLKWEFKQWGSRWAED